jgi:EmrB/QacA subfamily drug resistance transporter
MSTTITSPSINGVGQARSGADPRRWIALALLALVQFMLALDGTIVNVALPTIKSDLGFSSSGLAWVINGYLLMAGGFLIVGGRVADIFGRRRMFVIGAIVFAVASAVSGAAQSPDMLVGARFVQGFGEALASPAALSLVVLLFKDPTERAKAIGAWGGITILGATLGVVISGVIVDAFSWRWIFLVNIPIAAVVVFVLPRMVSESRKGGSRSLDLSGALLITGALVLIADGLLNASSHGWGSTAVLLPLAIGAALVAGFAVTQATFKEPLVPRAFFKNRTRISANLASILASAAFMGMFFSLTLYMQDVLHYSPLKTGLAWGPFGIGLLFGIGTSMQIFPRFGVKNSLIFSYVVATIGLLLLTRINTHAHYLTVLLPGMLLMSFGQGISFPGVQMSGLHGLDVQDAGLGSAVQNTSVQFGGSLGLAVLVTIGLRHTASRLVDHIAPLVASTDGYSLAVKVAAATMFAGAILVATVFERVEFVPPDQLAVEAAESAAGEPVTTPAQAVSAPA